MESTYSSKELDQSSAPEDIGARDQHYTPIEVINLLLENINISSEHQRLSLRHVSHLLKNPAFLIGNSSDKEALNVFHLNENAPDKKDAAKLESYIKAQTSVGVPKFDLMLLNPPFGYTKQDSNGMRLENRFLMAALGMLSQNGRFGAIVPNGILGRESAEDQTLRYTLCENFHLSHVILLPLSAFSSAEVYTSILCVEQKKTEEDLTNLYDLRNCVSSQSLCEYYEAARPVAVLTRRELAKQQYILLPERYQEKTEKNFNELEQEKAHLVLKISEIEKKLSDACGTAQLSLFPTKVADLAAKKKLLKLKYELLACELAMFCSKVPTDTFSGHQLYQLKNGDKRIKASSEDCFPVYGASGVYGTAPQPNMETTETIIIGRVGSSCGNVYRAWTQGFISDNAIIVLPITNLVLPEFLLLLLCGAHLNRYLRGTGQPYITQTVIYHEIYAVPSLQDQADFLREHQAALKEIKRLEQELEVL